MQIKVKLKYFLVFAPKDSTQNKGHKIFRPSAIRYATGHKVKKILKV